jgi:hypothetical protein
LRLKASDEKNYYQRYEEFNEDFGEEFIKVLFARPESLEPVDMFAEFAGSACLAGHEPIIRDL